MYEKSCKNNNIKIEHNFKSKIKPHFFYSNTYISNHHQTDLVLDFSCITIIELSLWSQNIKKENTECIHFSFSCDFGIVEVNIENSTQPRFRVNKKNWSQLKYYILLANITPIVLLGKSSSCLLKLVNTWSGAEIFDDKLMVFL